MGIFDAFKAQPVAPVASVVPPVQTNQQQPVSSGSPMIDGAKGGVAENKNKENPSPLEPYADLWKDEPKTLETGNSETGNNPTPKQPNANAAPDFVGYSKKIDFARTINPELAQKALAGDITAFGQVINSVMQAAFAVSLKSSHSMIGKESGRLKESIIGDLPQHFKSFSVQNSGYRNPAFKHPAMKPIVDATKQQLMQKFPDATTDEIDEHVEKYLTASFEASGFGKPGSAGNKEVIVDPNSHTGKMEAQAKGEFDWTKSFGLEDPNAP